MTRILVQGTDQVQLPPDSTGRRAGFVKTAIGSAGSELYLPTSVLVDDAGNTIDAGIAQLGAAGTERGLVVRAAGMVNVRGAPLTAQTLNVVAATPVTGTGLDVSSAGNVTFTVKNTVAGTAYVGNPVIVFEQSDDNVSWSPLQVVRADTGVVATSHTVAALGANGALMFDAGAEGVNWVRVRVTTAQTTNGMTITTTPGGMPFSPAVSLQAVPTHGITDTQKVVDNAAFTDGTTPVMPTGFIFDEVAGTGLTENDIGASRMDSKRAQVFVVEDGVTRGTRQTVKAASTAAVAADIAAVVALSPNQNTQPNALYVRPRQPATYGAGYRLAAATASVTYLGLTFAVNTDKQLVTIHHLVGSTKTVRIKRISLWIHLAAAGTFQFEARRLSATTAPATGNPAITPAAYDSSDGAAEATCLALPTTQGSETATDRPLTPNYTFNAASATAEVDGRIAGHELLMFDSRGGMGAGKDITLRAGVAEGLAVIGRCLTAASFNFTVFIEFTEE